MVLIALRPRNVWVDIAFMGIVVPLLTIAGTTTVTAGKVVLLAHQTAELVRNRTVLLAVIGQNVLAVGVFMTIAVRQRFIAGMVIAMMEKVVLRVIRIVVLVCP